MVNGGDRNLLFGILAMQLNFISREDLIAATSKWIQDKSQDLDKIMLDDELVAVDEHQLLAALIEKHLERHDGDVSQSLASLSSIGTVRDELLSLQDEQIEATLSHVTSHQDVPRELDSEIEFSPMHGPDMGLRFRVIRSHAKGGLGEIFLAHDEELHREVALKQIQAEQSDNPNSRARFVQEAEITGRLEHPGIVPVYGLGHHSDGRPFYAMRFIRGDSLKEAITNYHAPKKVDASERRLQLRQLLGRFVDICQAVEYAHSRGILHRDLKPGNIMLGKYGETLVVDWGLAKSVGKTESVREVTADEATLKPSSGHGSTPTMVGSAVGTPAYMSPEQAAGKLEDLGPATDVYGLGATLFCLLTGKSPFSDSKASDVVENVIAGRYQHPRSVDASIAPGLEAVCVKAMALDPEDRYASPIELANDIENWLGDEPVSSYRDGPVEQFSRWARKHRTLVTSSMAILILLAAGLVAGMVMVTKSRHRVLEERNIARNNAATALHNLGRMHLAARQYDSAIDVFEEAINTWRSILDVNLTPEDPAVIAWSESVSETLAAQADARKRSGQLEASYATMDKALQLRQQIWRNNQSSTNKIVALAKAFVRTGDLRKGKPETPERQNERVKWYTNAIEMLERLELEVQVKVGVREVVIRAFEQRAQAHGILKNHASAVADWSRILPMISDSSKRRAMQLEYGLGLVQLGRVDEAIGEVTKVIKHPKIDGSGKLACSVVYAWAYDKLTTGGGTAKISADECARQVLLLIEQALTQRGLANGPASENVLVLKLLIADPAFKVLESVPGLKQLIERLEKK